MKKLLFGLIATVFMSITSFGQEVLKGEIKFPNSTYKIYDKYVSKYQDNSLQYQVDLADDFQLTETIDGNIVILTDKFKNTIKIEIIKQTNNSIVLNIEGSNGKIIKSIEYISVTELSAKFCWKCVATIAVSIISATSDLLGSGSDCAIAINACVASGGTPSTTITNGFFGQDCSVSCIPAN